MTAEHVRFERDLDATIEQVWQVWTDPAGFAAWYGPDGVGFPLVKLDVRVGGRRQVCMELATPEGPRRMWFAGEFLEVEPPNRPAYTESLADEQGNPVRPAGMPASHPDLTEVRVELEDLGDRTRMRMTHLGVPALSPGARGWSVAFDKLAAYLAAV